MPRKEANSIGALCWMGKKVHMSLFLEILRCVLCCVEDDRYDNYNIPLYRNTSRETRETLIDAPVRYGLIFDSEPSNSTNIGSAYAKAEYVVTSSNSFIKYAPISSYNQPTPSSRLPKPSPEKLAPSSNRTPSRPKPPISSCSRSQSPLVPKASSSKPSSPSPTLPTSSIETPQAPSHSLNPSPSVLKITVSCSKPSPSFSTPASSASKPVNVSPKSPPSSTRPSPSASKAPPSFKPTLVPASSNLKDDQKIAHYILVQKDITPIYMIPKDIESLIKSDKVPEVLKKPLSLSTYKDYFAALLYAEDYYIEKWSKFKLVGITIKLQETAISKQIYFGKDYETDVKHLVAFEIDSSHEKRPFLLSRDFVFARPSGSTTEPFQGIIYRVQRSTTVLVEFGEDFHAQHCSFQKYDVSFSFNRVCLRRAHQAIEAASDPSFENFIFPSWGLRRLSSSSPNLNYINKLDANLNAAVHRIITIMESPPYLLEGPPCVAKVEVKRKECNSKQLSSTGLIIQQAVFRIYRSSQKYRILICAPINRTCDVLMRSLKEIPESEMFRANAAFREIDGVPTDILASSLYKGDCFACPKLQELRKFKIILSTYVSSFQLHNEGIAAGHFSHIFMVDASSATEPEAMVALANFANEKTTVIVTGAPRNHSGWVRSDLARKNGLMKSYFERLCERTPYKNLDPNFIMQLVDDSQVRM
ncbi:probable RNA helicase SDE3 isoform X1 [Ricinus communis]|uniref:probable RNA helicase SDE3 isoform X1 n=1 Tax=Ricinus communis TaxID=3988 RepID=UPI000D69ED3C|nr:probable RNA helicase SDE3 isoform X1 [Ricinus communis]|eukprot:XP_025015193.1 probable RNA helicase SDE3 isoform X1 [Ricinus communis]